MPDWYLLAILIALLLGLVVGKAWERYKLRDGRWVDRRRLRETPHYMLGLNFLVDNQVDQAIEELTQATSLDTDALAPAFKRIFTTTALPATMAGAIFSAISISGTFQGMMAPTTPIGSIMVIDSMLGLKGTVSPFSSEPRPP